MKMDFASNLRELLDFHDIELKELAKGTGISKNTLDNYLSGQKSLPNAENAVKIAQYIGTTVEYLVTGKHEHKNIHIPDELIADLYRMNKQDLASIKNIVHSLANKR